MTMLLCFAVAFAGGYVVGRRRLMSQFRAAYELSSRCAVGLDAAVPTRAPELPETTQEIPPPPCAPPRTVGPIHATITLGADGSVRVNGQPIPAPPPLEETRS